MALQATGLSKRFGPKQAVADVDLTLRPGQIVGLLGPSGSGKSTIFDMIAGTQRPDKGTITLEGRDITRFRMEERARAGLGYGAQSMSLFGELTAADNLLMGLQASGHGPEQAAARLQELSQKFLLSGFLDQPLHSLSGGQRRIVEFAFSIETGPRYLLLDEPFVKLDPLVVATLTRHLRDWVEEGQGVLVSSHRMDIVLDLIDEVYVLDEGRILANGAPATVLSDPDVRTTLMGGAE